MWLKGHYGQREERANDNKGEEFIGGLLSSLNTVAGSALYPQDHLALMLARPHPRLDVFPPRRYCDWILVFIMVSGLYKHTPGIGMAPRSLAPQDWPGAFVSWKGSDKAV